MITSIINYFHVRKHGYCTRAYLESLYKGVMHARLRNYRRMFSSEALKDFMEPITSNRIDAIARDYIDGATLESIAAEHGCTRERIRQIIMKATRVAREKAAS